MHYLLVSFSHKNSTIVTREKLAFNSDEEIIEGLQHFSKVDAIDEVMITSTCNRVEVFTSVNDEEEATNAIFDYFTKRSGIHIDELEGRADVLDDVGAIHHLFTVASSLDSLVVGETQIVGQLRDAFNLAQNHHFAGKLLSRATNYAFKCAAEVRNQTNISSNPVSIASVAVLKAKNELGKFNGVDALVIGSGEMSELAVKYLLRDGANVTLANRTLEKAEAIAEAVKGEINLLHFDELPYHLNSFTIVFTATSAKDPIITEEMIEPRSFDRFWFDMAIPRDIEINTSQRINLFHIDDLEEIVNENIAYREAEAKASYKIVKQFSERFFTDLQALMIEPMIKQMYLKASRAALEESTRVMEKGFIPKAYEEQVRKVAEQSNKRFLHTIVHQIRSLTKQSDASALVESLKYILKE
jgi:glutamyl-tRNA reductase